MARILLSRPTKPRNNGIPGDLFRIQDSLHNLIISVENFHHLKKQIHGSSVEDKPLFKGLLGILCHITCFKQYAEQTLIKNHDETFDNKMRFMKFTRENSMNFSEPTTCISISKLRLHSAQHVEHGEVSK